MLFRADSRIEFFTLRIQYEALYFPRFLGIMEIPRDHTDFDCLFEGLPVVLAARVRAFPSYAMYSLVTSALLA